jgi:hypothetical protein
MHFFNVLTNRKAILPTIKPRGKIVGQAAALAFFPFTYAKQWTRQVLLRAV